MTRFGGQVNLAAVGHGDRLVSQTDPESRDLEPRTARRTRSSNRPPRVFPVPAKSRDARRGSRLASSGVILSLRTTSGSAPNSPRYWTRL